VSSCVTTRAERKETLKAPFSALRPRARSAQDRGRFSRVPPPHTASANRGSAASALQRRRGYRKVFRVFAKLALATHVALPSTVVRDLLELKDAAQLYEMWCYFALVRELTGLLGQPTVAEGPTASAIEVSVRWELKVEWAGKARLFYNPRFAPSASERRSYSVPLRPDIALEVLDGAQAGWHLFDAKFRLEQIEEVMPLRDDDLEAQRGEERRGTFKRADLYKMHTYRDAIAGTRSVWILYPGSECRFFSIEGLRRDSLVGNPDGVGAIPLPPACDPVEARQILRALVA
jgi:predicted component of viral defense system (DUF524 family)